VTTNPSDHAEELLGFGRELPVHEPDQIANREAQAKREEAAHKQTVLQNLKMQMRAMKGLDLTAEQRKDKIAETLRRGSVVDTQRLEEQDRQEVTNAVQEFSRVQTFAERTVRHLLHKATMDLSTVDPDRLQVGFDHEYSKSHGGSLRFTLFLAVPGTGNGDLVPVSHVNMLQTDSPEVPAASRGMNRFLKDISARLTHKNTSLRQAYHDLHSSARRGATATWLRMERSMLDSDREANVLDKIVGQMPDDSVHEDQVRGTPVLGDTTVAWPLVAHMMLAKLDYEIMAKLVTLSLTISPRRGLLSPDSLMQQLHRNHKETKHSFLPDDGVRAEAIEAVAAHLRSRRGRQQLSGMQMAIRAHRHFEGCSSSAVEVRARAEYFE